MKDEIYVPISMEYLLSQLFGKVNYDGFVGRHTVKEWKKVVLKIIHATSRAIQININTDETVKNDLLDRCRKDIQEIETLVSKNEINTCMIEYLTKLVFNLIGQLPENYDSEKTSHPNQWKLNRHRKITYTQTSMQKAHYIIHGVTRMPNSGQSVEVLYKILWNRFNGDFDSFIKWFKEEHRDLYLLIY